MDDEIVKRLQRFQQRYFPRLRSQYRSLVEDGQHPSVLFIGCSDSRVVPYLMLDSGPGELFIVRNVGNFVPPFDASLGYHGTAAAVEFAVLNLNISEIIVCGHSHCGAVRALYVDPPAEARHMAKWLELGRDAVLPVTLSEEALRRTEQRSVALQLERLMGYPMVRRRMEEGRLCLRGWHYLIAEGKVLVLDVESGLFAPFDAGLHRPGDKDDPLAGVDLLQ
ncbi:MAG: carbonic anhydrase [Burkholderiales bacterium]|nr:carbonic anhydrase [Burkholderiales bacterium]